MVLDRIQYSQLVLAAFKEKRDKGELNRLLTTPTRARLRDACYIKYRNSDNKEDEQLLRDFFCPGENERPLLPLIKNFDADRLKALENYLKKERGSTEDLNVDLLAWLIDFKYRPFSPALNINLTDAEIEILEMEEKSRNSKDGQPIKTRESNSDETGVMDPEVKSADTKELNDPVNKIAVVIYGEPLHTNRSLTHQTTEIRPAPEKPIKTKGIIWYKRPVYIFTTVLSVCTVIVFILVNGQPALECMVWTGDHYEKIACNEQPKGRSIVPLNEDQFLVQKINREDTITEQHIGKLYYIKNNRDVQYFTHAGKYPEDINRELQKLSLLIYEKDSLNRRSPQITQR